MTATAPIAQWHRAFPGLIAGLVSAATSNDPIGAAAALASAGLPVHVEYVPRAMSAGMLREIARAAGRSPVSVQVTGLDDEVDAALSDVLSVRPQRVVLQWPAFTARRAATIRAADARAWVSAWNEWDGRRLRPGLGTEPDGILVMLSEPEAPERCRIRQINVISASAAGHPAIPVAAVGGITEAVARLCLSAGAQQIIVGRALYARRT